MEAIERIKGYCCEVTKEQWEELVRVAHSVNVQVFQGDVFDSKNPFKYYDGTEIWGSKLAVGNQIPFPDFLAKLKGAEPWEPKAGEMVEVEINGKWKSVKFVGYNDATIVWFDPFGQAKYREAASCRPLRPTITRAQAESFLNKRIID